MDSENQRDLTEDVKSIEEVKKTFSYAVVENENRPRMSSLDFNRAIISMLREDPFFCNVSRFIRKIESSVIPTAGVSFDSDEFVMYWNPYFFGSLREEEVRGVFKHELYHICLAHITSRQKSNKVVWNIATDLAINSLLSSNNQPLPSCGILPGKMVEVPEDRKLTREEEEGLKIAQHIATLPTLHASEWYYENIMEFLKKNNLTITSWCWGIDDHSGWDNLPEQDKEYIRERLKEAVGKAVRDADQNNGWGTVPAAIQAKLRELYSNEIDWRALLRHFCGTSRRANTTHTMKRINRKYPYVHPGAKRGYTANMGIFIDQSGSVGDKEISLFFGELSNLAKKIDFDVFFFDTTVDVKNKICWKRGQKVQPKRTRCGGTDFQAVVNYVNKNHKDYDGVLILTDGECCQPQPSKIRLGWVICPGRSINFPPRSNEIHMQMKKPA